jgi:hypothetical protein
MRLHFPAFRAWKLHGCQVTFRHGEAPSVLGSNKLNIRGLKGFASLFGEISGLIHELEENAVYEALSPDKKRRIREQLHWPLAGC